MTETCEHCQRTLSSKSALTRHKTTSTKCLMNQGKIPRPEAELLSPCTGCGRTFSRKNNRKEHLKTCPLLKLKARLDAKYEEELHRLKSTHEEELIKVTKERDQGYARGRADATKEIIDSLTGLDKAQARVKVLEKRYLRKKPRVKHERNVVYALTTEQSPGTFIVGSAKNLENRLSTYDKTCKHRVVRISPCGDTSKMKLMERMVLSKLEPFREVANHDRFTVEVSKLFSTFEEAEKFLG